MHRSSAHPVNTPFWIETLQSDTSAAADFHAQLFGWELHEISGAPFSRWSLDGQMIGLLTVGGDAPPHWAINVAISDADSTAALVESLGGTVILAPFGTQNHRNVVIAGPVGAIFACSAAIAGR